MACLCCTLWAHKRFIVTLQLPQIISLLSRAMNMNPIDIFLRYFVFLVPRDGSFTIIRFHGSLRLRYLLLKSWTHPHLCHSLNDLLTSISKLIILINKVLNTAWWYSWLLTLSGFFYDFNLLFLLLPLLEDLSNVLALHYL